MQQNKLKDRIVDFLYDELDYIYCDSCRFQNNDKKEYEYDQYNECEDCQLNHMNWEISKEKAEYVANAILYMIGED